MPDLTQMQTFILVSRLGSLAAVARELGVSAAAISKQVTRLEAELGLQLLLRSTRRVELTEVGKSYCEQCKRIFEEVEAASNLVSEMKVIPHGVLKVVSGRHFGSAYIVPHLREFLVKYPGIRLTLELTERIPDVQAESIDVLIGMSVSAAGDVIQRRITATRYCLCASKAYLKQFGIPIQPKDLLHHRYIAHSMRKPDDELTFRHKERVVVVPYLRVNDAETMLHLAKEGLGIVSLHEYVVRDLIKAGVLIELLEQYGETDIPLYVAFPQRRYLPAKVRCFLEFIDQKM